MTKKKDTTPAETIEDVLDQDQIIEHEEEVKQALRDDPRLLAATGLMLEVKGMSLAEMTTRVERENDVEVLRLARELVDDDVELKRALEDRRAVLLRADPPAGFDSRGDRILASGEEEVEVYLDPANVLQELRDIQLREIPEADVTVELAKAALGRAKSSRGLLDRRMSQLIECGTKIETVLTRTVLRGGMAVTYRLDTHEVTDSRPATSEEKQELLPEGMRRTPLSMDAPNPSPFAD